MTLIHVMPMADSTAGTNMSTMMAMPATTLMPTFFLSRRISAVRESRSISASNESVPVIAPAWYPALATAARRSASAMVPGTKEAVTCSDAGLATAVRTPSSSATFASTALAAAVSAIPGTLRYASSVAMP